MYSSALQVWGPSIERVCSAPGIDRDRTRQIPRAHLPATRAETVNFKFSESLSQVLRVTEEDTQCPPQTSCMSYRNTMEIWKESWNTNLAIYTHDLSVTAGPTSASVSPNLCPRWEYQVLSCPYSSVYSVVVLCMHSLCAWLIPWVSVPPIPLAFCPRSPALPLSQSAVPL